MAAQPDYPLLTADEFLGIEFGDRKAELDNGVIRMIAGSTARHARVAFNLMLALDNRLRGSSCTPYNGDIATRTNERSIRYPDVTVFCGHDGAADDERKSFDDSRVLFEVLSGSTARTDLRVKLPEYVALPRVDTIVFVDIAVERIRIVQRTGPHGWSDVTNSGPVEVHLPSLDVVIPHDEIFARD